ncbi:hypothetical protein [Lactococcus protaetiae]|uniref:Uncharacterized protein n=1 Tax=Lactococcus protaetiae TaxID=2592653 RepID=A0A514Z6W6_9LACT|nr:hypothetical protein [Lactococcus protaetiae]QDK70355.1 hypothetical protein FLP15_03195 [Lactococcus protaetiae]QDK71451.1 hypothetical protein FLP15_10130 [Lactococcus protaetiae]
MRDAGQMAIDFMINLPTIVLILGLGGKIFKRWFSRLTENINDKLDDMEKRIAAIESSAAIAHKELEKEVLRLQLLEGINSERLSASEVAYFYDRYVALGGNSFVSEKVHEYLEKLNGGK